MTSDIDPSADEPSLTTATFSYPVSISNLHWPREVDSDPSFPHLALLSHDNSSSLTVSSTDASVQEALDLTPSHAIPYTFVDASVLNPLLAAAKIGSVEYSLQKVVTFPRFVKANEQPISDFEFLSSSSAWNDPNVVFSFKTSLPITSPAKGLLVISLPALFQEHSIIPPNFSLWVYVDSVDVAVQIGRNSPLQFGASFAEYLTKGNSDDFIFILPPSQNSGTSGLSNSDFSDCYFKVVRNFVEIYSLPALAKDLKFRVELKGMVNPLFDLYFRDAQATRSGSAYQQLNHAFDTQDFAESYVRGGWSL